MKYSVRVTPGAERAILTQARYIAIEREAPVAATAWVEQVFDAVDSLRHWPRRCRKAEESMYRPYEVRRLRVGGHLVLFTIDDPTGTVWVIGFRSGRMRPRWHDLPWDPLSLDS